MGIRYFNLKIGKPDMYGGVIEVNPGADLESRLHDYTSGEDSVEGYKFKFLMADLNGAAHYEMRIPDAQFVKGGGADFTGESSGYVNTGEATVLKIKVERDGNLKIYETGKSKPLYLNEITEIEARKIRLMHRTGERCNSGYKQNGNKKI